MLTARDIMTTDVVTIGPEATVREAAALMVESGAGALPVVKDGRLVGILSHTDYTLHEGSRPVSGAYTMMRRLLSPEHMEATLALADGVSEVMATCLRPTKTRRSGGSRSVWPASASATSPS